MDLDNCPCAGKILVDVLVDLGSASILPAEGRTLEGRGPRSKSHPTRRSTSSSRPCSLGAAWTLALVCWMRALVADAGPLDADSAIWMLMLASGC